MFENREHAGRLLGEKLRRELGGNRSTVVLGIPRGGVVIALAVARALGAPLDVILPRKIGAPREPELAVGAVAVAGDERIVIEDAPSIAALRVERSYLDRETDRQVAEIRRREAAYRTDRAVAPLLDRRVILVDDGVATGLTARAAAVAAVRAGASEVVVAVPVAPEDAVAIFAREGLRLLVIDTPSPFVAVGRFYQDFHEVTDDEVRTVLADASTSPS